MQKPTGDARDEILLLLDDEKEHRLREILALHPMADTTLWFMVGALEVVEHRKGWFVITA